MRLLGPLENNRELAQEYLANYVNYVSERFAISNVFIEPVLISVK